MNESEVFNKRVESIEKLLEENYRNLDKIKELISTLGKDLKRDVYRNVEGVVGTFDGLYLVDSNGNKHEVPANYAAKSRLVYGDTIKMIDDNGATVFKQIQKVERKKSEGVLSKKEGKWVVLTDTGSYKVSDVAVDHNQAQMNDEVVVYIPATNLNAPYAALDRLVKERQPSNPVPQAPRNQPTQKPFSKPVATHNTAPVAKPIVAAAPKPMPKPMPKPEPKIEKVEKKEPIVLNSEPTKVTDISLEDDDDLR